MRDPHDNSSLLTNEQILFSRYLSSFDWQPVHLRPQAELRALALIANPSDLAEYELAALHVDEELERIRTSLGEISTQELASEGSATLNELFSQLREGYDILYLMAHGMLVDNEPWLWLEDESGKTQRVSGNTLIARFRELEHRPRLIVLASCQSAGNGRNAQGALAALGPRLAEAGIPAVVAMQGNISVHTVEKFMPVFFRELQVDGQLDRVMAVARGTVRDRRDWWLPALFMRLKNARIWYAPGFTGERGSLEKWPAVLRNVQRKRCTPILGPGVSECLLGSRRDMAKRWAEKYHFPMSPYHREDLPQVAQYLSVQQDPMFPRDELESHLQEELKQRYKESLPPEMKDAGLEELIEYIGKQRREASPAEPYRVLASLPLPLYVTTNPGNLLEPALLDAGKEPQVELCRWNSYVEDLPSIYDENRRYRPSERQPLVYHLFGSLQEPRSLVLTEDDYFDYLIGVTTNKDLIPAVVRRALVDTALLFLGFQLDDWNFRVLFRSIMNREGQNRRSAYAHVAAQISPEEGRILEPDRARSYLEEYFQDADVSIYWGNVEDFTRDLYEHLQAE
ncbi:MAG: CHAT domain-containing protein [bacterium]|nr:CHAT domain-containing protein [bacterium]